MKRGWNIGHATALLLAVGAAPAADLGTAFTYQGRLVKDGTPVTSDPPHCDFTFGLWDQQAPGGNQKGNSPQVINDVEVIDGLFAVTIDFGGGAIDGTARWLEITVQCPGDAMPTTLAPRKELTPAPHALALPGLYTQQTVTSPNIIGGFSGNSITAGVVGATIGGGGRADDGAGSPDSNRISDNFGTIGGGEGNQAGDEAGTTTDATWATVGGGLNNRAIGSQSTVGGGEDNFAIGFLSAIAGGWTGKARGDFSAVGGGLLNEANGHRSTVPGGSGNWAGGDISFAAGRRARVRDVVSTGEDPMTCETFFTCGDEGTFVWADATNADFWSTGPNQFLIRAGGGVGIGTNAPTDPLTVNGVIRSMAGGIELPDGSILDSADDLGIGDITSVAAGTGLTGGGPVGDVTLNVAHAGTGSATTSARSDHYHSVLAASDGTPSAAVSVDGNGNVGIGTAVPQMTLDVQGPSFFQGSSLYLRNPAAPADAQTCGMVINSSTGLFVLGRSSDTPTPGALVASSLAIDSTGNVGIGKVPDSLVRLDVDGQAQFSLTGGGSIAVSTPSGVPGLSAIAENGHRRDLRFTDSGISLLTSNTSASPTSTNGLIIDESGRTGAGRAPTANRFEVEGEASKTTPGSWVANSDQAIKANIRGITNALETILKLRPVAYRYTDEYKSKHRSIKDQDYYNYIAQEFREVFPEWVQDSGEDGLLQVDSYPASVYSVAAIQELYKAMQAKDLDLLECKSRISDLAARNHELAINYRQLAERVNQLEALVRASANTKGEEE